MSAREKLFTLRMNNEEQARLNLLAAHYGISVAAVLRMLVKERADNIAREKESDR